MGISIGARQYVDGIRSMLSTQFARQSEVKISLAEQEVGEFTFIDCYPGESQLTKNCLSERTFKQYIASALAEIILRDWEKELIDKEIKHQSQCFTEQERRIILDKVSKVLNNCDNSHATTYQASRKTRLVQKLLEYLEISNKLILDGFIKFRLKEYQEELQTAIEVAVDEFMVEKEYLEFVRLLRYFVDIQEPKIDTLHVLVKKSGGFQLFDENRQFITNDYFEDFATDLVDNEITYEDLLISALITIAPKFVVLHTPQFKESETIRTIRNVFDERVSNCQGCALCNSETRS
ncbi:MAG: putative sporulation protein YtxC [Peptococcaceae bacterium]|nr:putative sporulation protein YtxC [Peptococcaceae bacterium]